jgi:hypothetical protein
MCIWKHIATSVLFNDAASTAVITHEECTHKFDEGRSSTVNNWNPNHRGAQIPDARSSWLKTFCALVPDVFGNAVGNFLPVTQHAPRILR